MCIRFEQQEAHSILICCCLSCSIFETAKPVGQLAVDAVQSYQAVVTTVEESRATAQNASVSVAATQAYLTTRPIATLSEEAEASRQASTDLKDAIEGGLTDTQGMREIVMLCMMMMLITDNYCLW